MPDDFPQPRVSTAEQVLAFVRTIATRCKTCLYRTPERCENCESQRARILLISLEAERRQPQPPRTVSDRMTAILAIVSRNRRPTYSHEIDIRDYCNRTLKRWTLRKLVRIGRLEMTFDGRHYAYSIPTIKGDDHGNENCHTAGDSPHRANPSH